MKTVIQRVQNAKVRIAGEIVASINLGLLVLVGIEEADTSDDYVWLSKKITNMRIFSDENSKMNHSVLDVDGAIIVVSQFTLHASTKKGNRPSYIKAAKPNTAIPLYHAFVKQIETDLGKAIQTGEFGANMQIELCNDGPVTILIDSKNKE